MLPLQLVDSFLLNYNVGQALLLVFVLATVGVLPLKSQKLLALNVIVFGLIFYLGLGVLSRLMPQAQIFFIAMPLNIMIGFAILAISLGAIALVWLERFERFAVTFM